MFASAAFAGAAPASAHPLGNFTVNRYSGIVVSPHRVRIVYVVDMAEIPTFQTRQQIDGNSDGIVADGEAAAWRQTACPRLAAGLRLRLDGQALVLATSASRLSFPPGAGGLATLRLECGLTAATGRPQASHALAYSDGNFTERVGWREITIRGDGTTLAASDTPATSISARLTSYPNDLLRAPLDQRSAAATYQPGGAHLAEGGAAPDPDQAATPLGVDRATRAFTGLVARQHLGPSFALVAIALALLLGALHALAPGHGKTVMAAYLLGLRGSLRQALLVGTTVTATHTAGVLALGVVLSASTAFAPERLYPWLGLASGLLLTAIGVTLLRRTMHTHHQRSHPHPDADAGHRHQGTDHAPSPIAAHSAAGAVGRPLGWRSLVSMGFAGGLVPSPSALVVLLGAIALGRAWFGVLLVVAYGAGMAATLTGAGLLLVQARTAIDRRAATPSPRWGRLSGLIRLLPVASASVIVAVGLFLALQGVNAI